MKEVFGAVLSVKDNVSGVMKQAKESTRGYRGEVEKTKKELEKLDKKKIREKELKIKNSEAYKAIEGVKKKLQPLAKKTIEIQAKTEHAVDKVKKVKSQLDKIKSTKVVQLVVKGGQKAMKAMGKGMLTGKEKYMKEKIILGNKVELPYDSIGFGTGTLAISFKAGDITTLEKSFRDAGQNNLELIQQCDAEGHVQATHERYDIFREITKTIGATPEEDVVTVTLEQESLIEMRLRHLEAGQGIQDGAIQDLGDVVSGMAEAQGVSL